jgi:cytochrome bd-type quinol oxidase subunit 1
VLAVGRKREDSPGVEISVLVALLFVPWAFLALVVIPAVRGRATAAFAVLEAAAVAAQLIYRHARQFSHGVAQLWPVRIYVATGLLLVSALLVSAYLLLRRHSGRRRRVAIGLFVVCSALLPFWFVLAGITYSS